MNLQEKINASMPDDDEYLIGYGNLHNLQKGIYKEYNYGISIAMKLNDPIIDAISEGPTQEYSEHYMEINQKLGKAAIKISEIVKAEGFKALPVQPTFSDKELTESYKKELRTDLSHKMTATRAGLGWIGKTDLFISKKFGPRVRLASVLTDGPIEPLGAPISESKCGSCNLCVKKCPAEAATGALWNDRIDRDIFYDPFKCRNMCLELTEERMGTPISICGICISVCPIGKSK